MKRRAGLGFTLVELLVVIALIIILVAFIAPAINHAVGRARTTQVTSNLRQIGAAMILFVEDHNGMFPVRHADSLTYGLGLGGRPRHWQEQLDEYVGGAQRPGSIFNHVTNPIWYSPNAERMGTQHFGLNHHMTREPWRYRYTAIPSPSRIVIVGEINANTSEFRPDQEPAFDGQTITRYRISNPGNIALYLYADGRVSALEGNQGEGVNREMYRWW